MFILSPSVRHSPKERVTKFFRLVGQLSGIADSPADDLPVLSFLSDLGATTTAGLDESAAAGEKRDLCAFFESATTGLLTAALGAVLAAGLTTDCCC